MVWVFFWEPITNVLVQKFTIIKLYLDASMNDCQLNTELGDVLGLILLIKR